MVLVLRVCADLEARWCGYTIVAVGDVTGVDRSKRRMSLLDDCW
jgi:hypothetical protein